MKIRILDSLDPEAMAMIQALYSRSAASVDAHMEKVRARGTAKFMESYYVGYGHASIGDCGTTTMFFEGVSLLAAKAIQNNPLYSGQESSTRYIDFTEQPVIDPLGDSRARAIMESWRGFYLKALDALQPEIAARFPCPAHTGRRIWSNAVRARCFDIARGFLPAGITTQLSWTTNFRQAHDNLTRLAHHPLAEARKIATRAHTALAGKYRASFSHLINEERMRYLAQAAHHFAYDNPADLGGWPAQPGPGVRHGCVSHSHNIDNDRLERAAGDFISRRPRGAELPRELAKFGTYECRFWLDYGSFRDLQRHRNGYCAFPAMKSTYGFHPWYIEQLPDALQGAARAFVHDQFEAVRDLQHSLQAPPHDVQYLLPLGTQLPCHIVYGLPQMVYLTELRSRKTVHPTLREIALAFAQILEEAHPRLALHCDNDPGDFDIRRGAQDITECQSA